MFGFINCNPEKFGDRSEITLEDFLSHVLAECEECEQCDERCFHGMTGFDEDFDEGCDCAWCGARPMPYPFMPPMSCPCDDDDEDWDDELPFAEDDLPAKPKKAPVEGLLVGMLLLESANLPDLIRDVIFVEPETIVVWKDGTRTIVKAQGEAFDKEKGVLMAFYRRFFDQDYMKDLTAIIDKAKVGEHGKRSKTKKKVSE